MNQGWMRVREAAYLLGVSTSTVRRRIERGELKGRTGRSGRREVFIPKKLRDQHADVMAHDDVPAHALRGTGVGTAKIGTDGEDPAKVVARIESAVEDDADNTAVHELAAAGQVGEIKGAPTHEMLRRYERLAGGSLMLAEQRTHELKAHVDHAYEQLAHTRGQLRRCRKIAYIGWGGLAGMLLLGLVLTVTLSVSLGKANAKAVAQEQATAQAQQRHQDLINRLGKLKTAAAFGAPQQEESGAPADTGHKPGPPLQPTGLAGASAVTE